ncbi:ankyrin repeat-containing domain protein [Hyaloraphidium curvatum]|nr:ankyrin repeat-containing domain protein [Hyaloraphidium curvatum]
MSVARPPTGGDGVYTPAVVARILAQLGPPAEHLFLRACADGDAGEVDRLLRATSVSVDCGEDGETGLVLAARGGHAGAVRRLLLTKGKKGIAVNVAYNGWTPLLLAAHGGHAGVVAALAADPRCDLAARTPAGETVLHVAARRSASVLEALLAAGSRTGPDGVEIDAESRTGWTPLLLACVHQRAAVPLLLRLGADPTRRTPMGNTCLHLLASHDRQGDYLRLACSSSAPALLESTMTGGWTPFHVACARDNPAGAAALLDAGADPAAATGAGNTGYALAAQAGNRELVRMLQARGAAVVPGRDSGTAEVGEGKKGGRADREGGRAGRVPADGFGTPAPKRAREDEVGSWTPDEGPTPKRSRGPGGAWSPDSPGH